MPAAATLLHWSPRVLGVAVSLFVALFALDAFGHGRSVAEALPGFAVHLLPAIVLLALVALSWHRPWVGGLAFVALAVLYATTMARGHVSWMLVISGPLFVVGALFLWSWLAHRRVGQ